MAEGKGRPQRIQRKRTKGFKLPPNTVCVTRPGLLANPVKVERIVERYEHDGRTFRQVWWKVIVEPKRGLYAIRFSEAEARALSVHRFKWDWLPRIPAGQLDRVAAADFVACYCDPDDGMACHGDVLIEAAVNR